MSKLTNTVKQLFSLKLCRKCSARLIRSSTSLNSFTQSHTDSRSNTPSHLDSSTSTQSVFQHIHKVLDTKSAILSKVSHYHFNGLGKAVRPRIVLAAAQAFNFDEDGRLRVSPDQLVVAMVAEMIHTASLVHDDIIDESLFRRGNPSVFSVWGQSKGAFTGDYILGAASVSLAKLRHNRVMRIMSQILEDLVQGEFMQLGTKSNEDERFNHYIEKSYRKTASLLANSCQAVAVLSGTTESKIKMAFEYGKNLGISFQLIDDSLDYLSSEKEMGKPTGADLKLGSGHRPRPLRSSRVP
ncbi:PDSS1 [Bugula neritina]|uniref:PDSS1 n=1 Tax=Bugula neritina TaxID=10212 RepID=A0A7J7JL94_BUGNE|nr:PDSS1 [Bugula neritina]